ncbi:recombinase family protein [Oceanirhabdus seepicola]|uniref:Recombinase family protein n=1 Tax=Oceanirhabdus seepicola TaxID=2828781 RepID=A0A9J6P5E7_9CLOT|nr:recombinase family protein [Oceanirhabdus seepicola]MCM1991337.1 recombinase family protein [Oceanirhabdus seepicola]
MRCAVYVRVSTDREEQKTSLDNQKKLFYNLIGQEGWELNDFYVDVESGTTDKRENFIKMIEDAENKKFDCILAKELSRLARNGELSYQIRRVLLTNQIHLITLDGAINTLEDNTDKFGLYAWLYEEESQRISRRIKTALEQKAKSGEFKGSHAPYGYKVENKKLILREDSTVEAVKLMYQLYLSGKGFDGIARELDRRGYPTPAQVAGKRNAGLYWHASSIKLILTNPHYVGDLVQCRSKMRSITDKTRVQVPEEDWINVPNTHEALILREDFEAVQRMMKRRYIKRPKAKKHLFTNRSDCGTSLWYMQSRKGYVCGKYRKHGKAACDSHVIKEEYLKKIILQDLKAMADASFNKEPMLKDLHLKISKHKEENNKKLMQKNREIEKLKDENRKYLKLLGQEIIAQEEYRDITTYNREQIAKIQNDIIRIEESLKNQSKNKETFQRLYKQLEKILAFNDLDEEMLHRLVDRIEVGENQRVVINYTFDNPFSFTV